MLDLFKGSQKENQSVKGLIQLVSGDTYPALDDSELCFGNLALDEDDIFRIVPPKGLKIANEAKQKSEDAL